MPTVTKLFPFASSMEGWSANNNSASVLQFDSGNGNPAGSLQALASNSQVGVETPYFAWAGSWATLGVPSDQVVTAIRLDGASDKADSFSANMEVGPYSVYYNNNLQAELKGSRVPVGTEASWTVTTPRADQPILSEVGNVNNTIQLRIYSKLPQSVASVHYDQVQYVITYQPAAEPWSQRRYQAKPRYEWYDRNHMQARGLVAYVPYFEGAGTPRNRVNHTPATINGTIGWAQSYMGVGRDPGGQSNSNWESFKTLSLFNTKNCTAEVWMKFRSFASISAIFYSDNGLFFRVGDTGLSNTTPQYGVGTTKFSALTSLIINKLYHFVLVSKDGKLYFYVNGQLDSTSDISAVTSSTNSTAYIFRDDQTSGRGPDAVCECFRVWNRGLAQSEIQSLYQNPWLMAEPPRPPVFYNPLGTGSGNGTSSLTTTQSLSASGSFASLSYSATSSVTATKATFSSSSSFSVPSYSGSLIKTVTPTFTSVASRVLPVYSGAAVLSSTHATSSISAYDAPNYVGSATLTKNVTFGGIGSCPASFGSSSVTTTQAVFLASAVSLVPIYTGNGLASIPAVFTGSAQSTPPVFSGNGVVTVTHSQIQTSVRYGYLQPNIITQGFGESQRVIIRGYSILSPNSFGTFFGSVGHPTFAAISVFTIPVYTANASVSRHPQILSDAVNVVPVYSSTCVLTKPTQISCNAHESAIYTGNAVLTKSISVTSSATLVVPVYSAVVSATIQHPTVSSADSFIVPVYIASAGLTSSNVLIASAGSTTVPNYQGVANTTCSHTTISDNVTFTVPSYSATSSVAGTHATLLASAIFFIPVYAANSILSSVPTFVANGHRTVPAYTASSLLTITNVLVSASGSVPASFGVSVLTAASTTLTSSSHFAVPVYGGNAVLGITHPEMIVVTNGNFPNYYGAASLTASNVVTTGSATFPIYNGTAAVSVHPLVTSSALSAVPIYHGYTSSYISNPLVIKGWRSGVGTIVMHGYGERGVSPGLSKHPTVMSVSAFLPPAYYGNAVLTTPITMLSSGLRTLPVYSGSMSANVPVSILSLGNFTGESYVGTANLSVGILISATGQRTVPTYSADASLTSTGVTFGPSSGSFISANAYGSASLQIHNPFISSSAKMVRPQFVGSSHLTTGKTSVTSNGTTGSPLYQGNASLTAKHVLINMFGVSYVSGVVIRQTRRINSSVRIVSFVRTKVGLRSKIAYQPKNIVATLTGEGSKCVDNPYFPVGL